MYWLQLTSPLAIQCCDMHRQHSTECNLADIKVCCTCVDQLDVGDPEVLFVHLRPIHHHGVGLWHGSSCHAPSKFGSISQQEAIAADIVMDIDLSSMHQCIHLAGKAASAEGHDDMQCTHQRLCIAWASRQALDLILSGLITMHVQGKG